MKDLISRLHRLLTAEEEEILADELRRFQGAFDQGFKVVVIGGVSSGKSTLINEILRQNILPTDTLPTTRSVTRISYGNDIRITVKTDDQTQSYGSVSPEIWERLPVEDVQQISVSLPHENLRFTNLDLFDTPGIADFSVFKDQDQNVIDLVAGANGVIMTTSATHPLSQSELLFLQRYVKDAKIPRLLIVLTKTDLIDEPSSRMGVYLTGKLSTIGMPYSLIALDAREGWKLIVDGNSVADVWKTLREWVSDPQHTPLRKRQQVRQLESMTLSLLERIDILIANDAEGASARESEIRAYVDRLQEKDLAWKSTELALSKLLREKQTWLRERLDGFSPRFKATIQHSLHKASDIDEWYERDLPYLFRNELEVASREVAEELYAKIVADFTELERRVNEEFEEVFSPPSTEKNVLRGQARTATPHLEEELIRDRRRITRLSITVATIGSYFVFGPLGAALGAGGGVLNELLTRRGVKAQRKLIDERIAVAVERDLHRLSTEVYEKTSVLYEECIQQIKDQADAWKKTQLLSLDELRTADATYLGKVKARRIQVMNFLKELNSI